MNDDGSTSLAVVLTAPVLLALMFMAFQAALWNHARTAARVVAQETATLVAREQVAPSLAGEVALRSLHDAGLAGARVDVRTEGDDVVVDVTVDAPGIIRGTVTTVHVRAAVTVAGWVPL